ncbi:uncharacterized protein ZK1073.1-like isoform X2 [Tachypleus tridentatus]|uniref:uncharacterized protein ZK1073.1-like isoform X2 n=1 Tax=Tachypleus tridentatus TaxID=6853 RepID=UPI003FD0D659
MSDAQLLEEPQITYDVEETRHEIKTERCGIITVFVMGSTKGMTDNTPVFLTVHDMGCNHTEFHSFTEHPAMARIKSRSVFIHVEIPGQEHDAPDLPAGYVFPSMQDLGEDMLNILDYFGVKYVVTLGEGAGANILARFAMSYPDRVLGNILLHCTSTVAGVMEYFNDKIMNWKLQTVGMHPTAEQYLVFHKFGTEIEKAENKDKVIKDYIKKLQSRINPRNLRLYVEAFLSRTDISAILKDKMKVDSLLVTGSKASHLHTVHTMHAAMDPRRTTLLKVDGVGDVLFEAPDILAHNLLLFSQGLGLLSTLPMSRQSSISS